MPIGEIFHRSGHTLNLCITSVWSLCIYAYEMNGGGGVTGLLVSLKSGLCEEERLKGIQNLKCDVKRP